MGRGIPSARRGRRHAILRREHAMEGVFLQTMDNINSARNDMDAAAYVRDITNNVRMNLNPAPIRRGIPRPSIFSLQPPVLVLQEQAVLPQTTSSTRMSRFMPR